MYEFKVALVYRSLDTNKIKFILKIGEKLNEGRTKLDSIIVKLKQELETVENELKTSNERLSEMSSVVHKINSAGESVDCDEAVLATAPVFKQLLQG